MQLSASGSSATVVPAVSGNDSPQGGVEMAAAMAAKINAMLMAKGKLKPLQPLPSKVPPCALQPVSSEEVVVTEVDINDVPVNCRNLLTKGKTQEEIRLYSGAVVSTKGLYMSDVEKSARTGVERPLYLHVQGRTQDEVNKAVMRIKEIISEDVLRASGGQQPAVMPPVPIYPQPPRPVAPAQPLRPHLPSNANAHLPNVPVTPAHRPPPPHSGVGTTHLINSFVCLEVNEGGVSEDHVALVDTPLLKQNEHQGKSGRSSEALSSCCFCSYTHIYNTVRFTVSLVSPKHYDWTVSIPWIS